MSKHPQQITTADTALDDDMKSRIIKYSITMGIRTLCFVAAYFMFVADLKVLMWICVAGAVLLPYPAVIIANAGRERAEVDESALLDSAPLDALPPARGETINGDTVSGDTDSGDTIPGETVPEETVPGETVPGETVPGATGADPTRSGVASGSDDSEHPAGTGWAWGGKS